MRKTALAILIVLVSAIAFADWDQGREAFSSGDFEGAAAHLETVLEEHSDYAPAHYMLGLCRYNLEQVAEAIPSLQRAADLEPDNAQYALALARALLGEGRADVACDRLKTLEYGAVPEEMRKVFAQMLAVAATRSGRPELAIPVLEATVEDEPGDASLWMALGQTRAGAADQVGAFEAYSKASSIDQSNSLAGRRAARTAITIAETLAEASDRQLWFGWAAELADTAAQHERVADSAMVAGKAWLGAKELDKARAAYAMALEREPSRVDTLYELGRVESLLDQDGPALEHLGRALELAEDPAKRRNIARSTALLRPSCTSGGRTSPLQSGSTGTSVTTRGPQRCAGWARSRPTTRRWTSSSPRVWSDGRRCSGSRRRVPSTWDPRSGRRSSTGSRSSSQSAARPWGLPRSSLRSLRRRRTARGQLAPG